MPTTLQQMPRKIRSLHPVVKAIASAEKIRRRRFRRKLAFVEESGISSILNRWRTRWSMTVAVAFGGEADIAISFCRGS
jgi:hypothetical protein